MGLTLRREIISSMDRRFDYSFCSYPLMLIQIEIWNIYIYTFICGKLSRSIIYLEKRGG